MAEPVLPAVPPATQVMAGPPAGARHDVLQAAMPDALHDAMPVALPVALAASLAALRALGAPQRQPLRYAHLQALARRAQAHSGAVRQLLDAKLQRALQDCRALLEAPAVAAAAPNAALAGPAAEPAARPAAQQVAKQVANPTEAKTEAEAEAGSQAAPHPTRPASPLAGLLATLRADTPAVQTQTQTTPDLKVLQHFRGSWARLRLDQQLDRSLARVPGNAGPLNTQRLLLQALGVMRAASPEYLQRLMAQVEALRWIEQATAAQAAVPPAARRGPPARARKTGRA